MTSVTHATVNLLVMLLNLSQIPNPSPHYNAAHIVVAESR